MKTILIIMFILVPVLVFSQEFDFTREYDVIPVSFDGVECQVPWTTGYNYINPTFCDIDGDQDFDLIIGSDRNRLTYLNNSGDINEAGFTFIADSLVFISFPPNPSSQLSCCPAFADIDYDADNDLILGGVHRLFFYKNIGTNQYPIFQLEEEYFQQIQMDGDQYPFFADIDNDNDYDLFIGKGYLYTPTAGRIYFYLNEGTPDSANMVLVSEQFEGIDLGYYAIPAFTDIDNDGDYDMFLGDEDGRIHFYRNEGTPEEYDFVLISENYFNIDVGLIASPTFCDIDGDGDFDLFVGERSWGEDDNHGDIWFYENVGSPDSAVFELVTQNFIGIDVGCTSSPAFADINNDGLVDMFLGETDGNINYFSNTGIEEEPSFSFSEETFQNVVANYQSKPDLGDLDNDGDLDLVVGRVTYNQGSVKYYRNEGTPETPEFILVTDDLLGINYEWPAPRLIDIDNDDDLDLFMGHAWNQVDYWENVGTPESARFEINTINYLNTTWRADFSPVCFGDLDSDGDYDMLRAHEFIGDSIWTGSYLDFYRNNGTSELPDFVLEETHFLDISLTYRGQPYLIDIDSDGDLDLFMTEFSGGISFWRNNEYNSVNREQRTENRSFALLPNYPNPFNTSTTIPFTLDPPYGGPVKVVVYNQLGQVVWDFGFRIWDSGENKVVWDAEGCASGVYLVRLTADGGRSTAKPVILLK